MKKTEELDKNRTKWAEEDVEAGQFEAFRQIVRTLRSENGCPWDREQTFESLKPCMINEMTEAIAAIDLYDKEQDASNLCEELGDVLLQVVLLAQIAQEEGLFQIEDVIRGISRKMIRRHPHVFHDPQMEELLQKLQEEKNGHVCETDKRACAGNSMTAESDRMVSAEIPGLWEMVKQAERRNAPAKNKEKEKAAFGRAAEEVILHLQKKISETAVTAAEKEGKP